jgi:hypothetical protein
MCSSLEHRRRHGALLLIVVLACVSACNGTPSATSPAPVLSPAPVTFGYPSFTLNGTVTDATTGQPIRDVRVFVNNWPPQMRPNPSDAAGQYQTLGVPITSEPRWLQAAINGYVQQCAVPLVASGSVTTIDIQLVRPANLSQISAPSAPAPGTRVVSGRVVAMIDGARTAIPGASVGFEPDFDYLAAWTTADQEGRFLLCGLPTSPLSLSAWTPSKAGTVVVAAGPDATVEIELK